MSEVTSTSLSAGEAAKLVGKSIPTITRAIKNGKLSAKPRKPKGWIIERSELLRVFDAVVSETNTNISMLESEILKRDNVLQVKLEVTEQRLEDAEATIQDLRDRLDAESTERRQLTAQLTDQREQPKGIFRKLFG